MTDVQHSASVHEKTVQKVARDQLAPLGSTTRRWRGKHGPITVRQVHPAVMATARRLLRPGQRIRIVSTTEVLLENDPSA